MNGSDFPLAPMDPIIGMHIMVNGTDIFGRPAGWLNPRQHVGVEEALRTYTVYPARASFSEDRRGMLKEGYDADFVMLSENILDPAYLPDKLCKVKALLTVLNGHVVHEDFSGSEKVLDFGG